MDPTKLIATTSLLVINASTASLSPFTTLNTPFGKPASKSSSANFIEQDGSFQKVLKQKYFHKL